MKIETERLVLRGFTPEDYPALRAMMDADTMWAYGHRFSDMDVADWLSRQINRMETWGFSLCAVELKDSGAMVGQCGITVQDCLGAHVPEVGYVFGREYWHHGYATEAAAARALRAHTRAASLASSGSAPSSPTAPMHTGSPFTTGIWPEVRTTPRSMTAGT